jgi:cytoskeletal protein CcmA (bactofilin family)
LSETTGQRMNHLDEMTCLLYLERQLDRARAQEVSAHTQDCAACRTLLRALERESRLLTRAMLEEEEALPARLAEFQERAKRSLQWIWAVAFGLAATGAYALYTDYIERWQQQLDQAGFGGTNVLSLLVFQGAFWKGWQSMATLLEVIALLTLAGVGAAFFRRRLRRGSALAQVLAGFCVLLGVMLALPTAASATEFRRGQSVTVAKDETVKSDLFISGTGARIDGTVDGDVFFFGQRMEVNGHVTGDVIAFGQAVQIRGQVDGNVRFFGNNVTVSGSVGKNMMVFNDFANVESGGKVGGSLTAFAGSVGLDGRVGRDLLLFVRLANISGTVGGGIRAKGDSMTINSTAEIDGPVHFEGHKAPDVSPQAKLASPVEFKKLERKPEYLNKHYYIWRVIWTAALILFGLVLFMLLPKFGRETISAAEQFGAPIGLGVLVFFGVPIAAIIACITVVGIPLGILAVGIWFLMLCCAELVVGAVVGNWILGRGRSNWEIVGRMALGFVLVRIVYTFLAQVHVLGLLGALGIWMWGMGAISLALYKRFQPVIAAGMPSSPPLPPNTTVGGVQPA